MGSIVTNQGIELVDVYLGQGGYLTGTARVAQQARERLEQINRQQEIERRRRKFEHQKSLIQSQIQSLTIQLNSDQEELEMFAQQENLNQKILYESRDNIAGLRKADQANLSNQLD